MVCIPCIVIPFLLWLFYKYIQPFIIKFWRPSLTTANATNVGPPPPPPGKADSEEYGYIHDMITMYPVVVFAKTTCKFCKMAKDVLDDIGVSYCLENIEHHDNMAAVQDMFESLTGARTVPRVFVGGKCVGGGSDLWSLHNMGNLLPMLESAGADFKKDN